MMDGYNYLNAPPTSEDTGVSMDGDALRDKIAYAKDMVAQRDAARAAQNAALPQGQSLCRW